MRWERDRAAMDLALRRHDEILREALSASGGYVFKTVGDAFCAAFSRAEDAVAASLAAQLRLAAEDFSAVDGVRVRAALHTGTAEERDGDYFGPAVNRVARLLGIAYGGQVLLSGTTRDLVQDVLPDSAALHDLGFHRLKDLVQPERVYQLRAPGLLHDFPPLRSLEVFANNLPLQMTSFVGRESEVAEIVELMQKHRLVTVAGAGGVGKTRVTLQAGAEVLENYRDGVWFVELAPLSDPQYLPTTIAQAMELRLGSDGEPMDLLIRSLKHKQALLVFDNCEHVVEAAAQTIGALLRACPELTVLASSRQALGITGEATFRMPPLAIAAGIALFAERAVAAERRFVLTAQNEQIVADICRRLDGIPLAIELAAARVKTLSPAQLRDRLDERFRVVAAGSRDVLPRHQTLRALIDWSYDLLDERERALFRNLGAFVSAFTLEGASALGALDELDAFDLVTSLVDKSLVQTEADADDLRYRLLESTRAYALEKLLAGRELGEAERRHGVHFAALAAEAYRQFDSQLPPGWLERLAPDLDDLRAALKRELDGAGDRSLGAQLAADCGPIFLRLDLLGEGLRWCEAARAVTPLAPATAGRIEYVASMMHNNLGAKRQALDCAERAVAFYRASSDERGLIRALSQVAQQYARAQRFDEAQGPAAEAIARARSLGEKRVLSGVLRRCGYALPASEIQQARGYFSEALVIARSADDAEEACMVLQWWANCEADAGSLERAIELASEGLECAGAGSRIFLENHIAGWTLALGRIEESAPHARRALALALEADNPLLRALAIAYCAPFHAARNAPEAAMLFGYASAKLDELEWEAQGDDRLALNQAVRSIERALPAGSLGALLERGGRWGEREAEAVLPAALSTEPERASGARPD